MDAKCKPVNRSELPQHPAYPRREMCIWSYRPGQKGKPELPAQLPCFSDSKQSRAEQIDTELQIKHAKQNQCLLVETCPSACNKSWEGKGCGERQRRAGGTASLTLTEQPIALIAPTFIPQNSWAYHKPYHVQQGAPGVFTPFFLITCPGPHPVCPERSDPRADREGGAAAWCFLRSWLEIEPHKVCDSRAKCDLLHYWILCCCFAFALNIGNYAISSQLPCHNQGSNADKTGFK